MDQTEFNREKCAQRNRIAARREEVEAVPFYLFQDEPDAWTGLNYLACSGDMPTDPETAIAAINARCALEPVTADMVHIHYMEAGNGSFVPDRFCFLGTSTLQNIAADAHSGFAFMNSHATGSVSTPAQLPFGRTFGGRYEKAIDADGKIRERALVGFYMVKGVRPAGSHGPSTDEMSKMIRTGTVFDCSPGLYGGKPICDVCGQDLNAFTPYDATTGEGGHWDCPHAPGTTWSMTEAQITAQRNRGVPDGCASYTLVDAHPGETSAVFDGAIPGAGFKKLLSLQREGALSPGALAQGHRAYRRLIPKGDLHMADLIPSEALDSGTQRSLFQYLRSLFGQSPAPSSAEAIPPLSSPQAEPPLNASANEGTPYPSSRLRRDNGDTDTQQPDGEHDSATRLAAIEQQNAILLAQNAALLAQFTQLQAGFGESQKASTVAAYHTEITDLVKIGKLTAAEGDQWRAFAMENPNEFRKVLETLKERPIQKQFADTRRVTAAAGSPAQQLIQFTKARQKQTGERYDVAFKAVVAENPELAAAHAADRPSYAAATE